MLTAWAGYTTGLVSCHVPLVRSAQISRRAAGRTCTLVTAAAFSWGRTLAGPRSGLSRVPVVDEDEAPQRQSHDDPSPRVSGIHTR